MGWPLPRSAQQRPGLWQSAEGWPLRELSAVSAGTFPAQLFLPDLKISGKLYPAPPPAKALPLSIQFHVAAIALFSTRQLKDSLYELFFCHR